MDKQRTTAKRSCWPSSSRFYLWLVRSLVLLLHRPAGSKIAEVVEWKKEMAPRIERMDREGTVSFSLFHIQYDKEQREQYERIKELEKEVRQIEVMKQKIESLERAQLDRNPRYQPPQERRP
jgi:septal ring factor EnvC (AmiA/AmiB activator)